MSIRDDLRYWSHERRLRLAEMVVPGEQPRAVYLVDEVWEQVYEEPEDPGPDDYRLGLLQSDFDRFSSGQIITVGYGRENSCFFKLLDPGADGVWELRSRDPKPSVRVFGFFAEPDVFVATNLAFREQLGPEGSKEWADEIRRAKATWRQFFQAYQPLTEVPVHELISNSVEVGDL